ncbi:MAG: hypothetical protein ACXW37_09235 [Nitrospira sp.]
MLSQFGAIRFSLLRRSATTFLTKSVVVACGLAPNKPLRYANS